MMRGKLRNGRMLSGQPLGRLRGKIKMNKERMVLRVRSIGGKIPRR